MTRPEINEYIFSKKIPVSFVLEKNKYCILINNLTETFTNFSWGNIYSWNNMGNSIYSLEYSYLSKNLKVVFKTKKETFEQCLGEFLIWWEINKSRFTDIKYYEE